MVYRAIIFKTLLYFDLFNFPPNKEELWQFLQNKVDYKSFEKSLKQFRQHKSFYFINNKKNVNQRIAREKTNKNKIKIATEITKYLKIIPTVKFMGISGSLSMRNAQEDDDIDVFIISERNLIWLTRIICIIVLSILGRYRKKNDRVVRNKICLNFLIDEKNLKFQKSRQNLYTAHEIVQLLPLFQKDKTYFDFIRKNDWIEKYLPNFNERIKRYKIVSYDRSVFDRLSISLFNVLFLEKFAKFFQLGYMKRDITIEEIKDGFLAFHPINYEKKTLSKLHLRTKDR